MEKTSGQAALGPLSRRLRQAQSDLQQDQAALGRWSLLLTAMRPYRWFIVAGIALNALHGVAIVFQNFLLPMMLALISDEGGSGTVPVGSLVTLLLIYLGMSVIGRMACWHAGYRLFTYVRERMICALRAAVFRHLQRLCLRFHDGKQSGELFAYLFGSPINQVVQFYHFASSFLPGAVLTLLLTMALLMTVDWQLTVLLFVTALTTAWMMRVAQARVRVLHRDFQAVEGDVSGRVADYLRGSRAVKLYAMEQDVSCAFDDQAQRIGSEGYRRDVQSHVQHMKQEGIFYVAFAVITLVAGLKYINGELSLAAFPPIR